MLFSIRPLLVAALLACLPAWNAHANFVGFSSPTYSPDNGQLIVTVVYDFSDFAMASGGFDLLYDAGALEFVSFTLASLAGDVWFPSYGSVVEPGVVTNMGLSTKLFGGIISAGEYGTIVFDVLSTAVGDPGCGGFELCLVTNAFFPFITISGQDVTDQFLADAFANVVSVPLPASLWLFGSALLGWRGLCKKT